MTNKILRLTVYKNSGSGQKLVCIPKDEYIEAGDVVAVVKTEKQVEPPIPEEFNDILSQNDSDSSVEENQ